MSFFRVNLQDAWGRLPQTDIPSEPIFLSVGTVLTLSAVRLVERKWVRVPMLGIGLMNVAAGLLDIAVGGAEREAAQPEPSQAERKAQETLDAAKTISGFDAIEWDRAVAPVAGYMAGRYDAALDNFSRLQEAKDYAEYPDMQDLFTAGYVADAALQAMADTPFINTLLPDASVAKIACRVLLIAKEAIRLADDALEYVRHTAPAAGGGMEQLPNPNQHLADLVGSKAALRLTVWKERAKESLGRGLNKAVDLVEGGSLGMRARRLELMLDPGHEAMDAEAKRTAMWNAAWVAGRSRETITRALDYLRTEKGESWPAPAGFAVETIWQVIERAQRLVEAV